MTYNRSLLACMLLLVAVTFATYANSLSNGFVWDDHQILETQGGIHEFPSFSRVLTGLDSVYQDERGLYYRPVHRYIHQLELYFFGLTPRPFHCVSILLHTINALLLFRLTLSLRQGMFAALVTALLFAVHPVNSEGVNFITSRQNMWVLFFTLTAALTYLHAVREQRPWQTYLAGLFFLGGLLCKETALMPLVFLGIVMLITPPAASVSRWRSLLSLAPFALAVGMYAILRLTVIPLSAGLASPQTATLLERIGRNVYLLPKYAFNLVVPTHLSAYYSLPKQYPLGDITILTGWLLIMALLFYCLRRRSLTSVLILIWLTLNWLPVSNIIPFPSAVMADRYLYLPAISIWFLAGCLAEKAHLNLEKRWLVPTAVAMVIATLALLTVQRNHVWKNDLTLFASITKAEPWATYAGYNLGKTLFEAGRAEEARREWERTVQIEPDNSKVLNGLGNLALMSNDFPLAERYYRRSVTADQHNAEAHYNLALIYERAGRYPEAATELELFLRRVPPEYASLIPEVRQKLARLQQLTP